MDRGAGADSFVRVADLGRVTKAERLPHTDLALVDGTPGVVAARMETGRRVDLWSSERGRSPTRPSRTCPAACAARCSDQSLYTSGLGDLVGNFLLGALLVMIVMVFTMGWRATLSSGRSAAHDLMLRDCEASASRSTRCRSPG